MTLLALLIIAVTVWLIIKKKPHTVRKSGQIVEQLSKGQIAPGVTLSVEMVRPDPEEWAREREAAKKKKQESIDRLIVSFVRPASMDEAFEGMRSALNELAVGYAVSPPNFESLWAGCQNADSKKTERQIKKRGSDAYKRRTEPIYLVESLALCLLHTKFVIENLSPAWKVSTSVKRLLTNLNHEKYRSRCIGFLHLFAGTVKSSNPDLAKLCEDEIARSFTRWYADDQNKLRFNQNLVRLAEETSASDKHFTLNAIIEYLDERRRFDPSVHDKLIEFCEEDIRLYKRFLAHFASLGSQKMTFEQALKSQSYMCPSLPSFNALWEIYEEEGNKGELERLHKLAKEIRYSRYVEDDTFSELSTDDHEVESAEKTQDPCPVEYIEVVKSGQKGKLAFIDSKGDFCSTEEAVRDHFENLGYRVVRGEVQFWQAMFGLAFWEEIFDGTDAPIGFNDIPIDLFSGDEFYSVRKERIDQKFRFLKTASIHDFIASQLEKYGKTWTRIIFNSVQGDFSYRATLESEAVSDFLKVVSPSIFSKIVYRIAQNPNGNRAGIPDYSIWKGAEVFFIEVKGAREKIRESQLSWLAWMNAEEIPVKIIRVKGSEPSEIRS